MSDARLESIGRAQRLVVVVDRRMLVRLGLAALVRDSVDTEVLCSSTIEEAIARVDADRLPDVVLLGVSGADAPQRLVERARTLRAPVVCVVGAEDRALTADALAAEADTYLSLDDVAPPTIRRALAAVAAGEHVVSGDLVGHVAVGPRPQLTERCVAVLNHLIDGLHDDEIAALMGMSTNTVRKHIRSAELRLNARTRTEAVAIAIRAGLLS